MITNGKRVVACAIFTIGTFMLSAPIASATEATPLETIQILLNQIAKLQEQINALKANQENVAQESVTTLKRGDKGELVKELQMILSVEGVFNYEITGNYGQITEDGVKKLQKKLGLPQVGKFGPQTSKAVKEKYREGIPVAIEKSEGERAERACLPPGHLISLGQAKNGLPNLPPCKSPLPPGIVTLIGQRKHQESETAPTPSPVTPPPLATTPPQPVAPPPTPPTPPSNLPTVSINVSDSYATETDENKAVFTLMRSGNGSDNLSVQISVTGTAQTGDYHAITAVKTIPAGFTSISVELTPTDDNISESTESVTISIIPSSLYSIGIPSSALAIIIDNDDSSPNEPPGNITSLTVTKISPSELRLAWTDSATNEDGFKIERSGGTGYYTEVANLPPNSNTWSDFTVNPDLSANTYSYRIRSFNDLGESQYSNTVFPAITP